MSSRTLRWPWLLLGASLFVPSLAVLHKEFGGLAAAGHGLALVVVLHFAARHRARWLAWVGAHRTSGLAALTLLAILVFLALSHPLLDVSTPGAGIDSDDALELGVRELVAGRFPYRARTYLGNALSPLPGALLLAAPFVLLGEVALQTPFWLGVLFLALSRRLGEGDALLFVWLFVGLSPGLAHEIAAGRDYAANAIFVLLATWLLSGAASGTVRFPPWLAAACLGVALSSRANFLLLVPLVGVHLAAIAGWSQAWRLMAVAGITFAAITLPFYLVDPGGFSPLHTANKLRRYENEIPHLATWVLLANALLALALARPRSNRTLVALLLCSAIVLVAPVPLLVGIESVEAGSFASPRTSFAMFAGVFGAVAAWLRLGGGAAPEPSVEPPPATASES